MKTDELNIRAAIDRRLSFLRADTVRRNAIRQRIGEKERSYGIPKWIGGKRMKKKLSFGALSAAILVLLSLTALAAGMTGVFGNINWLGEVTPEETGPIPEITPAPETAIVTRSNFETEEEILNSRAERELVAVSNETGGRWTSRIGKAESFEKAREFALQTGLPFPNELPEGYHFVDATVYFDCLPDGEFILTSSEMLSTGAMLERYRVDESMDFVSGYTMRMVDSDGAYVYLHVYMDELSDTSEPFLSMRPDEQARVLQIDGMDNAIAVRTDELCHLLMRQVLKKPVEYLHFFPDIEDQVFCYGEVRVDVTASKLDEAELADMFKEN